MGSTQRNDTRRAVFFERLFKSTEKRPDLSFGEFANGALGELLTIDRLAHLSDTEIAEAFERFALLGPEGPKPPA